MLDGQSGSIISKWPRKILALPHSITADEHDNIWITDIAWHQVLEFTHDGRLLLTLGVRGVPGLDAGHFNQPSDVAVASDGSFYVSDGYGNNRIVHVSASGQLIGEWGTKGSLAGQLNLPHGLTLDRAGNIYVVDRSNNRIQIFNSEGRYIREIAHGLFENAQDVKVDNNGSIYVASAGTDGRVDNTGVVILSPNGKLLEKVGRFGNYDGQFYDLHWLAIGQDGSIYTADFGGRRVQKFMDTRRFR